MRPDSNATTFAFMVAGGDPLAEDRISFRARILNETHYDLQMCFIQTVDFLVSRKYTDGTLEWVDSIDKPSPQLPETEPDLDIADPSRGFYWYGNYKERFSGLSSTTAWVPPQTESYPFDSPLSQHDVQKDNAFLVEAHHLDNFWTHLVVDAGWPVGSGQYGSVISGYPIALSTAEWHLAGEAVNSANSGTGPYSLQTTRNMNNWDIALSSGQGERPGQLPEPDPEVRWIANGDKASKYLTWYGNSHQSLGDQHGTIQMAVEFPFQESDGRWMSDSGAANADTRPIYESILN